MQRLCALTTEIQFTRLKMGRKIGRTHTQQILTILTITLSGGVGIPSENFPCANEDLQDIPILSLPMS